MDKMQIVIQNYTEASLSSKVFIWLRLLSCPFDELITLLPKAGKLLDFGCGYGILTLLLEKRGFDGKIVGIDLDQERIATARKATKAYKNITFVNDTLDSLKIHQRFSTITIIDVLYLLPNSEKLKVLKKAHVLLSTGGKLLIKINDRDTSLPYFLTWLQEKMTVQLLKKTATRYSDLYFESPVELSRWLNECGFKIEKIVKLQTPFPFFHPHHLVIAVK